MISSFSSLSRFRGLRIGLLGGSFNPPHAGHVYISQQAIKRLRLDYVWWMVSPQNPLKPSRDMAPFSERVKKCERILTSHRSIEVCVLEASSNTQFTSDILRTLVTRLPSARFFWLMGADNALQFHRWKRWESIPRLMPVVIMDRSRDGHCAVRARAFMRFKSRALHNSAPMMRYLWVRTHPASSSAIRKKGGSEAAIKV